MTVLAGLIAQVLHIVLMAAAAPTLVGIQRWMAARLAGRVGPSPLQPWRDLRRLLRKQSLLADSASHLTSVAPPASAAATAIAACLVPSFALGMTFAPLADLLVIAGLLAVARCSIALAAMDAGAALGGMAASRTMLLALLSEPALLLVVFVLGLLAGSLDLDVIAAMQIENGADWRTVAGVGLAATLLVARINAMRLDPLSDDFSGADLALIQATDFVRLLVWLNLIGAMFLPFGMARAGEPTAWAVGVASWLGRTVLFAVALAVLQTVLGRIRLVRSAQMLGIAVLLGLLATVFLFAAMGTA